MGFTVFIAAAAPPKPPAGGVKLLPPATQPLSPANQAQLESAVTALTKEVAALRTELRDKPAMLALLPDVEIYLNALRYPLVYHEQIDVKKIKPALAEGMERARQLRRGLRPTTTSA